MENSPVLKPEEMDAAWFTQLLRERGHDVTVSGITRTRIGTGQIGKCIRFDLVYTGAAGNAPASLVGKFPSDELLSRQTGVALRNYYREVSFYRQLAGKLSIAVPECYYAAIIDEGPDFVLLLQDMTPAQQGDQLSGCSAETARAAVLELVGLQAPTWCDDSLHQYDWLLPGGDEIDTPSLYAQLLPGFLDRYGAALAADERDIISRVGASASCPLFVPASTPFCIEHVDYRLDNMLIRETDGESRMTVVDWQTPCIGKPMNDVAYFMGSGLLPEVRREVEGDILRDYHAALREAGIEDYDWEQCRTDYRKGSFSGFGVTVIASMIVERTERGDKMFTTMAHRHARHAIDLQADEFL
jgi:hypothetical protein